MHTDAHTHTHTHTQTHTQSHPLSFLLGPFRHIAATRVALRVLGVTCRISIHSLVEGIIDSSASHSLPHQIKCDRLQPICSSCVKYKATCVRTAFPAGAPLSTVSVEAIGTPGLRVTTAAKRDRFHTETEILDSCLRDVQTLQINRLRKIELFFDRLGIDETRLDEISWFTEQLKSQRESIDASNGIAYDNDEVCSIGWRWLCISRDNGRIVLTAVSFVAHGKAGSKNVNLLDQASLAAPPSHQTHPANSRHPPGVCKGKHAKDPARKLIGVSSLTCLPVSSSSLCPHKPQDPQLRCRQPRLRLATFIAPLQSPCSSLDAFPCLS